MLEQERSLNESWRLLMKPIEDLSLIHEAVRMTLESHYSQMMDSSLRAQHLLAGLSWADFGAALSPEPHFLEQARVVRQK
jgi:hypothetical protein